MTVFSVVCLTLLSASGLQDTLDSFEYRNSAAAQKAWRVSDGLPAEMTDVDGRRLMKVDGNLTGDSRPDRVCMDRNVKLNLKGVGEFTLRMATDRPEATSYVSLYFRSGGGWYSMAAGFQGKGRQTLHFYSGKASIEGKPAGWDKIDMIRIAFWRAGALDGIFLLDKLSAVRHEVVVVDAGKNADDTSTVAAVVRRMENLLSAEGVGFDRVDEDAVERGALDGRAVAILPFNPRPSNETFAALRKFVEDGGRLFVCYSLSKRMGKLLGFELGEWRRGKGPGHFAEIRFDGGILGMPKSVKQASWNINTARPVEHNARVVARWHDDQGKPTGEPAMLLSDRGAYLTHIVLPDDATAKRKMLLATVGHLAPVVWKRICEKRLEEVDYVGHCRSLDELAEHIKANGSMPEAVAGLESAKTMLAEARRASEEKKYHKANSLVSKASEKLGRAYLLSQPSPAVEARGWWNHSGSGPYPGDWDRALEELSQAGFNMVFPNMLWGGEAHYPSEVLPRSRVYEELGDQIAQCLAAAKKYGIEVHVWKVNHNLQHHAPKKFVDEMRRQGRMQVSVHGQPKDWLCPSHPDNLKLEADSMIEVVEKYDVDGLHFDYIRYPDGSHCYCDGCRTRFEAASGKKVANWPEECHRGAYRDEYRKWRAEQITRLVATVAKRARAVRKDIKISAAVFGSYPSCRNSIGQDWVHWAKSGYVDFLCPMDYTASDMSFQALIKNQLRLLDGCVPIYPGIGATATGISLTPTEVLGQVHYSRKLGAGGFTIFNLGGETTGTIVDGFGHGAGKQRAKPPHAKR